MENMDIIEKEREIFKNYLIENREFIITIKKFEHLYITINKKHVDKIKIVSRNKKDCVRVLLNDGSYEDFPHHEKEEIERILT